MKQTRAFMPTLVDNTQLYISLDPDNELNFSSILTNFENNFVDIWLWITQNLLRLNDNKTNIIYLAPSHCVECLSTPTVQMYASLITPNGSLKKLGVIFDKCIKMYEQVTSLRTSAYYYLKNIYCLKESLPHKTLKTVVHSFVTTRIDSYNYVYGISGYLVNIK